MVSYQAFKPFKKNPQRITELDKEFAKKLDYSGSTFPVTIKQISQIERQNEININLFGYNSERKSVYPIRVSRENYHDHLKLLYIEEERDGLPCAKQHYVYVKYVSFYKTEREKAFLHALPAMFLFKY